MNSQQRCCEKKEKQGKCFLLVMKEALIFPMKDVANETAHYHVN